jgi:hypothetical protein
VSKSNVIPPALIVERVTESPQLNVGAAAGGGGGGGVGAVGVLLHALAIMSVMTAVAKPERIAQDCINLMDMN